MLSRASTYDHDDLREIRSGVASHSRAIKELFRHSSNSCHYRISADRAQQAHPHRSTRQDNRRRGRAHAVSRMEGFAGLYLLISAYLSCALSCVMPAISNLYLRANFTLGFGYSRGTLPTTHTPIQHRPCYKNPEIGLRLTFLLWASAIYHFLCCAFLFRSPRRWFSIDRVAQ